MIADVEQTMTCCQCDAVRSVKPDKRGTFRRPLGWHAIGDDLYCDACWSKSYVVRAVTLPVWGIVDGGDMATLWEQCRSLWATATGILNWASTTLYANDIRREPGADKLGKMPPIYLYGLAKSCAQWHGVPDKQSGGALLKTAEAVYRKDRYEVLWTAEKRLRNYTYPQPIPISSQVVRLVEHEKTVAINLRLGGQRWTLRLGCGQRYRRMQDGLRHLLACPDLICESAVYPVKADGDARQSSETRDNSGGGRVRQQLMVKIVGWFPVNKQPATGSLRVRTGGGSLLHAVTPENDRIWMYNVDHAKRIVSMHAAHLSGLARLSDDRKAERRKPKRNNRQLVTMYDDRSRKDRDRLTSLVHEVTASLVSFARRSKCRRIEYDDTDRSFAASFPWRTLMTICEQKCRANGLEFVDLSTHRQAKKKPRAKVPSESPEPLATEQGQ